MTQPWFVIQTEPMRETLARDHLAGNGFAPYLPRVKDRERIAPLFPGYLFVGAADRWYAIRATIGVRAILMWGEHPAQLPAKVITEIRNRERGGLVRLPLPSRYRRGDRVAVLRGPFRDHLGVYLGMSGKDRDRVLLELLGRLVAIDLPTRDLRRA